MTLTIEAVVDAYRNHDLSPIEGEFITDGEGETDHLCCGLTAYAISQSESKEEFLEAIAETRVGDFESVIFPRVMKDNPSVTNDQLLSFIAGWDGQDVFDSTDPTFYTLGNNAWKAVNEEMAK